MALPHDQVRGIVIYWRTASPQSSKRRRRQSLQLSLPLWQAQHVGFHEVSPSGVDEPPRDADEQSRFVRLARSAVVTPRERLTTGETGGGCRTDREQLYGQGGRSLLATLRAWRPGVAGRGRSGDRRGRVLGDC